MPGKLIPLPLWYVGSVPPSVADWEGEGVTWMVVGGRSWHDVVAALSDAWPNMRPEHFKYNGVLFLPSRSGVCDGAVLSPMSEAVAVACQFGRV